ncbi:N-acetylglucosamine-6-phosphate deacetylase [Pararhodobacter zhoushanensis]|uniref:N-acetylglucosamine-6-phosphate deacetylase n=1 Tax=Pararhodobacter zhoushanensis TaxID=2479545 RepID=UPI000F8CAC04|nr:N-acetylglucosamine-6-phosphate deacetylase [Pararhodobacter zhoushanensis]
MRQIWRGARVFDGWSLHDRCALVVEGGRVVALAEDTGAGVDLGGGILAPGFIDLQVNGGGGALLGQGDPDKALALMCAAHGRLGTAGLMPTLITADRAVTADVLGAGIRAAKVGLPGFLGLHLEGPHLDPRRKGAHDARLIRPMEDADLAQLCAAARALPVLMVTLAPESATPAQIAALAAAGLLVSLGHSDCTEAQAHEAQEAGARVVTHLFNAMSPLGHRAPGLTGAALEGTALVGIIPDGVHVARTPFRLAVQTAGERLFAVTDSMAVAGTDDDRFTLNGRTILRQDGRLTLEDGTLAGADVSFPQALAWMTGQAGIALETALAMMTRRPAQVLGLTDRGVLTEGAHADLVHLSDAGALLGVWRGGVRV